MGGIPACPRVNSAGDGCGTLDACFGGGTGIFALPRANSSTRCDATGLSCFGSLYGGCYRLDIGEESRLPLKPFPLE
jgi:hypothetical protein